VDGGSYAVTMPKPHVTRVRLARIRQRAEVVELMLPDRLISDTDKESLNVWCAYPEDTSTEAVTEECVQLLSEDERARWLSFRFEHSRCEYLTTRALVRTALSHCHPLAPDAWRFQSNTYGKPAVEQNCGLSFNLSNSLGLVVCLIAQGASVGVDVESYERAGQIVELASDVLAPREQIQLEALRGRQKANRALSLWTLKEAYIKAIGMGLSLPLKQISFLFDDEDGIRLELDHALGDQKERCWKFCLLDCAEHRIALMVERANVPRLQLWEVRPITATPTRLSTCGERWFPAPAVSP